MIQTYFKQTLRIIQIEFKIIDELYCIDSNNILRDINYQTVLEAQYKDEQSLN